mgnify:CR=1 FL=1
MGIIMTVDSIYEEPVQRVKEVVLQHFKGRDVRVYLFGSWARGEQKMSSDIDIAIDSRDDISYEITLLRERLEESTIPRHVDVVDMHHAGAAYAGEFERREFCGKNNRTVSISRQGLGKISRISLP